MAHSTWFFHGNSLKLSWDRWRLDACSDFGIHLSCSNPYRNRNLNLFLMLVFFCRSISSGLAWEYRLDDRCIWWNRDYHWFTARSHPFTKNPKSSHYANAIFPINNHRVSNVFSLRTTHGILSLLEKIKCLLKMFTLR